MLIELVFEEIRETKEVGMNESRNKPPLMGVGSLGSGV